MSGASSRKAEVPLDDLKFVAQTTKFTKQEIESWYEYFNKKCPDGAYTKEAYLKEASALPGGESKIPIYKFIFAALDTENRGFLDFREFMRYTYLTTSASAEDKLGYLFSIFDVEVTGHINKDDCIQVFQAMGSANGKKLVEDLFNFCDKEGRGFISQKQFVEGCLNAHPEARNLFSQCFGVKEPPIPRR